VQLNFIAAGDLNGDERDDVAASGLNVIALSYQSSDGTLGTVQRFTPEAHAERIFIADWNGDGRNDLGLITELGFLIYAQQANGRLSSTPQRHADIPVTAYAAPVDWNSDGRMDLALWHVDPLSAERFASLRIYLQDSEGGFTLGAANAHPGRPSDLTVGDLNSDGRPDLAVSFAANRPLGTVTIYLQDADGALGQRQVLNMDAFGLPGALVITDLNGSNGNDLLVLHSDLSSTYFTQNSAGTLDPARDWPMGSFNGSSVNSAAVADDDGDGFPDLIGLNLPVEGLLFLTPALVRDTIYLPLIQR
jgi:hypothetical protein